MGPSSRFVAEIPSETLQAARKVYHLEHIYLLVGDQLCDILSRQDSALLDPTASLGGSQAVRLALVSAFQYAEHLPDAIAADATLKRMDWKYALHLPLQHPGIEPPALCQYRQNLFFSFKSMEAFQRLMDDLGHLGLYPAQTVKTLDAEAALLMICKITRFYRLNEAMKAALSMLVSRDPEWLRANAMPHWYTRYQTGRLNMFSDRMLEEAQARAAAVGADISQLLARLCQPGCRVLRSQPEILRLARLWEEQFISEGEVVRWRLPWCAGCASHPIDDTR